MGEGVTQRERENTLLHKDKRERGVCHTAVRIVLCTVLQLETKTQGTKASLAVSQRDLLGHS